MEKKRKYSIDFKKEVIGYVQLHNIITAAEYYKLGRNTIANWIKQYKQKGAEGLVRKKKVDNQEKKLDEKLVNSILEFKQKNPTTTLKKIKNEFNLDCSLALISRKLRRVKSKSKVRDLSKFKAIQSFSVYINVLSKVTIKGQIHTVYQINVEDNISHNKFIGYSLEKNSMNISLFIDYVLSNLKDKGLINSNYEIQSNIPNLIRNEVEDVNIKRFVTEKHKTNLMIKKKLNTSVSNIDLESNLFSHNKLIKSIYKELIFGKKNVSSECGLNISNIIIPPIFIDSFIQDLDKIVRFTDFWQSVSAPTNKNKLLFDTLSEIEDYGDKAQIEFDFEKAMHIYHKILITCNNLKDSDKLRSKVSVKQADLYYRIDNYDVTKDLLVESINLSSKRSYYLELGESFHMMGKVKFGESNLDSAVDNFSNAVKAFSKTKAKNGIFKYYESMIMRLITLRKYDQGQQIVEKYIVTAKKNDNKLEIANGYGIKSTLCFYQNKFVEALKVSRMQSRLANKIGAKQLEAKSIGDILNIYSFAIKKDPRTIHELVARIKILSAELQKPRLLSDSYRILGLYYYKSSKYEHAIEYFSKAIVSISIEKWKKYYPVEYVTILHYLGNIHYMRKEYTRSLKYFNKARYECESKNIKFYLTYLENSIAKSLSSTGRYTKAIYFFNRANRSSKDLGIETISANSNMYLGEIYKERGMTKKSLKYLRMSLEEYIKLKTESNSTNYDGFITKIKRIIKENNLLI